MQFGPFMATLTATVMAAGCDTTQQQSVVLTLSDGPAPIQAMAVRLYATQECAGSFQSSTTSTDGQVRFARTVEIGGVGVITDEISLCIPSGSTWRQVYGTLHGPAPRLMELKCDLSKPDPTCSETFDGRPMQDASSGEHDV